jgi:hypothetical protein
MLVDGQGRCRTAGRPVPGWSRRRGEARRVLLWRVYADNQPVDALLDR